MSDALHGDVMVASVTVNLSRNGNMAISGTITDEDYIVMMLESATDYLKSQKARRDLEKGKGIILPSYDTALHRTPLEQKLIDARNQIADAM